MVRTRADGIKATGAKAPRKVAVSSPRGSAGKGKERAGAGGGGGNGYNPQPIPSWQRPVASFFTAVPRTAAGASGSSEETAGGPSSASAADQSAGRPASTPPQTTDDVAGDKTEAFSSNGLISDEDD